MPDHLPPQPPTDRKAKIEAFKSQVRATSTAVTRFVIDKGRLIAQGAEGEEIASIALEDI